MRAARAGRHGARDRVQRRSGRAGAKLRGARASTGCTSSISTAPSRAAGQWRGGRGDPRRRSRSRCSSAAASAISPPSTPGSTRASRASSSAPLRCAIRRWCARRRAPSPARSPSASTPAAAGRRQGLGRDHRDSAVDLARRFEDAGVAAIIYTDIDRDGMLARPQHRATRRSPAPFDPGDRHRRPRLLDDVRALCQPDARSKAPSPAARSMMAGSTRQPRSR